MSDNLISDRNEFLKHLNDDVGKHDEVIEAALKCLNELKVTAATIKELGVKVEHEAVIPLGKNIYVNATLKHTGEYYLDKQATPNCYSVLATLSGTLKHFKEKVKQQEESIHKSEEAKRQIEDRIKLLKGQGENVDEEYPREDLSAYPNAIKSDKGVAVKVGDFYEIVEFEN